MNEFLPSKDILNRRHIEPVANCEMCGEEKESIKHVLLDCIPLQNFSGNKQRNSQVLKFHSYILILGPGI